MNSRLFSNPVIRTLPVLGIGLSLATTALQAQAGPAKPDPQMKAVLDQLAALHGKPIEKLTPAQARMQPGPPDAVKALLVKMGKSTAPESVASVLDKQIPGPAGPITVRVYKPLNAPSGPLPVLVYFHGGGFVISSVTGYDSSCRALANASGHLVASVAYRMAPEHRLPAAPEDAYAATQWIIKNASGWGGDSKKVSVAGESAGAALATGVCLQAKMRGGAMPKHQILVYPVAQYGFDTLSYRENANAKPLNRPMMMWFFKYALPSPAFGKSPAVTITKANVKGLPPATVILAQIDPLRSEGMEYANRLKAAGVPVRAKLFNGVTHEFFGMGAVVDKAKDAVKFAADGLK